jgi:hypothetical protein
LYAVSPVLSARIRHFLKRLVGVVLLALAGVALLAYGVDYVVFRYRVGANRGFGQVTITSYDAVPQKNGKTEFIFNDPQVETCVNSLFPRAGYLPCWYLQRHSEQRTNF